MVILLNLCKTGPVLVKGVASCTRFSLLITKSEEVASLCKLYARNQQNSVKGISKIGNKVPKLRIIFLVYYKTNFTLASLACFYNNPIKNGQFCQFW